MRVAKRRDELTKAKPLSLGPLQEHVARQTADSGRIAAGNVDIESLPHYVDNVTCAQGLHALARGHVRSNLRRRSAVAEPALARQLRAFGTDVLGFTVEIDSHSTLLCVLVPQTLCVSYPALRTELLRATPS